MLLVILLRHADIDLPRPAGEPDPDLNESGRDRALALADCLANAGVSRIFTSDARRTQQTAAPLAERLGLTPSSPPTVAALVEELTGGAAEGVACVVGHSNTVPEIIEGLGADASGIQIGEADFANLFVVCGAGSPGARLLSLVYGTKPP